MRDGPTENLKKNRGMKCRGYDQVRTGLAVAVGVLAISLSGVAYADEQPAAPEKQDQKPKAAEPAKEAAPAAPATDAPSAADAEPAPAADLKQPPEWHRARMRLSGSMCMSCLKALQDEFLKIPGVQAIKLRREKSSSFELYSPELSVWADCIIVYDQKRAPLAGLRSVMKQEGYYPYQVNDKPLDHSPSEADAKF
jgi:hypothetical protein